MSDFVDLLSPLNSQIFRSTLVIAALLLIRKACGGFILAKWSYFICLLGAVWLFVPETPPAGFSIWHSVGKVVKPEVELTSAVDVLPGPPSIFPEISPTEISLSRNVEVLDRKASVPGGSSIDAALFPSKYPIQYIILFCLWLTGVISMIVIWLIGEIGRFNRLKKSAPIGDVKLVRLLEKSKQAMGVNRGVLLVSDETRQSPALIGIVKPTIIVGKNFQQNLTDEQIEHVFLHELAHLRRGDLITQLLFKLGIIAQWFNPIAWLLAKAARHDAELATDSLVLNALKDPLAGKEYGKTLLTVARTINMPKNSLGSFISMASESQSNLETRITAIANFSKANPSKVALSVTLIVAVGISLLIGFQPESAETAKAKRQEQIDAVKGQLNTIVFPTIEFTETNLEDALRFLEQESRKLSEKGVDIRIAEDDKEELANAKISLKLRYVPLEVVLKYLTQKTNSKFRITQKGVVVQTRGNSSEFDLLTRVYRVPPTFLYTGGGPNPQESISAQETLERAGISFGEGTIAQYNAENSKLLVKNSPDQLVLVDAYIESIRKEGEKLIHIIARSIKSKGPLLKVPLSGGYPSMSLDDRDPKKSPVESGGVSEVFEDESSRLDFLKSGSVDGTIDEKQNTENEPVQDGSKFFGIRSVFSDPDVQMIIRDGLNDPDGLVEEIASVIVKSGQYAAIVNKDVVLSVDPVLGPDRYTVDLNVSPQFYGGLKPISPPLNFKSTIWDGQSVLIEEKLDSENYIVVLLTVTIMDPSGWAVNAPIEPVPQIESNSDQARSLRAELLAKKSDLMMKQGNITEVDLLLHAALAHLPEKPEFKEQKNDYLEKQRLFLNMIKGYAQ